MLKYLKPVLNQINFVEKIQKENANFYFLAEKEMNFFETK